MSSVPLCYFCHQPAQDETGRWYTILYDDGRIARGADVCQIDKVIHIALSEVHGVEDPMKRLKKLRDSEVPYNAACCCWYLVQEKDGDELERQYVVRFDGTIVTRLDRFPKGKRTPNDVITEGWQLYTPKVKIKNVEHALKVVSENLEARGYRRRF